MRVLYYSVHAVLEYDELSLFKSLGYSVFPLGTYFRFERTQALRPELQPTDDERQLLAAFDELGCRFRPPGRPDEILLQPGFIDLFDAVVVMHDIHFIEKHWQVLSRRPVVWRTIGLGIEPFDARAAGLRRAGLAIVRYSPVETRSEAYIGADATIRFYKNPDESLPWVGGRPEILTFAHQFRQRYPAEYAFYRASLTDPAPPFVIGGFGNEGELGAVGLMSSGQQQDMLRTCAGYFYCSGGAIPYTLNFIEAWMAGIPMIVADFPGQRYYEVPRLVVHEVDGLIVKSPGEAREAFRLVSADRPFADSLGRAGRTSARRQFGTDSIKAQWHHLLAGLTGRPDRPSAAEAR